jgi:serine/threonine protein kinase
MAHDGPLEIGALFLGKYEVLALIGRGGHACVYHAVNSFMGRHVAIKVLHRPGGIDRDALRRGQAEAQILNRLRHPNIVEVSDAGLTEDGLLYIVMELLEGRSLREVLNQHGSLDVHEVLALATEIAEGLHAAHVTGAIHRDLKPENVFVTRKDGIKILDFGIAKVADAAAWTTDKDVAHGTALYMSPEQLQLAKLTPRSDIYALGVVMYEALLGRHPVPMQIDSPNPTVWEISRAVLTREPPMLDELDARIPRNVAALVNRAMAKQPEQRFDTMATVAQALRECRSAWRAYAEVHGITVTSRDLAAGPVSAPPSAAKPRPSARPPPVEKLLTPGTAAPVTTRTTTLDEPGGRSTRVRWVVALGVLVGSSVGAAGAWLRITGAGGASASVTGTVPTPGPRAPDFGSTEPSTRPAPVPPEPTAVASAPSAASAPVAAKPFVPGRPLSKASSRAAATAAPTTTPTTPTTTPAPGDHRAPADKVDQRLRRLERALDD